MKTLRATIPMLAGVMAVAILLLAVGPAGADAPPAISYHGKLTDAGGTPINATLPMTFSLYSAASEGTLAWTEAHPNVQVTNGLFDVLLGENVPLSAATLNDNQWLGITVGSDDEMTPRQQLASVPYARTLAAGSTPIVIEGSVGGGRSLVEVVENSSNASAIVGYVTDANNYNAAVAGLNEGNGPGVRGYGWGSGNNGVEGIAYGSGSGVKGTSTSGYGGYFENTTGVTYSLYVSGTAYIRGAADPVFRAESYVTGTGVGGITHSPGPYQWGVGGWSLGSGAPTAGVYGRSVHTGTVGVWGNSDGVPWGLPWYGDGVWGTSGVTGTAGVRGKSSYGYGGYFENTTGVTYSLYVSGTSYFSGYATFGGGHADLAENYPASGDLSPGDVVVIDPNHDLTLSLATHAYDPAVAGVVSESPALRLAGDTGGAPLAIAGRVRCKVDASYGPIRRGDLLTTSPTPGHAMKAADPQPGTVLGKALEPLDAGAGLIWVLVTLQ